MTEARIEEIVAAIESFNAQEGGDLIDIPYVRQMEGLIAATDTLIADWRAKKAEIERLNGVAQTYASSAEIRRAQFSIKDARASAAEAMRAKCQAKVLALEIEESGPDWGMSDSSERIAISSRNRFVRQIAAAIAALKQS